MERNLIEYTIAEMEPGEVNLLFSSWGRSYRYATKDNRSTKSSVYYRAERDLIDDILARYPLLLVARAGNVALGWICAEATEAGVVMHYAYVKPPYEGVGIARRLFHAAMTRLGPLSGPGHFVTHVPDRMRALVERYGLERVTPEHVGRKRKGAA